MDLDDFDDLWEKLKTERDELRVQMHLAKAEIKDEWAELEQKWQDLENKAKHLQDEAKETSAEIKHSASVIVEEMNEAYGRIKDRLNE